MAGKERYPTAPKVRGKWVKTTNAQKRLAKEKVDSGKVRLAAMAPSLAKARRK